MNEESPRPPSEASRELQRRVPGAEDVLEIRTDETGTENEDAPLEARHPDEILLPSPFRDPTDFAPIPPPRARLSDLLELAGHMVFVLVITVVIPVLLMWGFYRLYRWVPFETMALMIVTAAALWAYRDNLGPLLRRLAFGRDKH